MSLKVLVKEFRQWLQDRKHEGITDSTGLTYTVETYDWLESPEVRCDSGEISVGSWLWLNGRQPGNIPVSCPLDPEWPKRHPDGFAVVVADLA
jgi:hypothetical protein